MSVLEEATEALRKRQEAVDSMLKQQREAADRVGQQTATYPETNYVKATEELAEKWLRLAAIEAGHNPFPAPPTRHSSGTLPAPGRRDTASNSVAS